MVNEHCGKTQIGTKPKFQSHFRFVQSSVWNALFLAGFCSPTFVRWLWKVKIPHAIPRTQYIASHSTNSLHEAMALVLNIIQYYTQPAHTHSYTYKWCMSIIIKTRKRVKKRLVRSRESLSDNFHWWNINKNMPLNHITWHIHAHSNTHTHAILFSQQFSPNKQNLFVWQHGAPSQNAMLKCVCECVCTCVYGVPNNSAKECSYIYTHKNNNKTTIIKKWRNREKQTLSPSQVFIFSFYLKRHWIFFGSCSRSRSLR